MSNKFLLGIDTSNYTTSVALANENGQIIEFERKLLEVKEGEKGLRQSDALFQHWNRLSGMLKPILSKYGKDIAAVCSANRPRPIEGSYMPVFLAGTEVGKIVAYSLGAEYYEISHQEGHMYAASIGNTLDYGENIILAHLSGGTLEFVRISGGKYEIVFATKDISYGQLIDRIGVFLGFPFPAGRYIDELALQSSPEGRKNPIAKVCLDDWGMNLSGLENSLKSAKIDYTPAELCGFLMDRISESFVDAAERLKSRYKIDDILVFGGVACSEYLRNYCKSKGYIFGQKEYCSDNAAGEALAAYINYKNNGG